LASSRSSLSLEGEQPQDRHCQPRRFARGGCNILTASFRRWREGNCGKKSAQAKGSLRRATTLRSLIICKTNCGLHDQIWGRPVRRANKLALVNFGLLLGVDWTFHRVVRLRNSGDPNPERSLRDALPGLVTSHPQARRFSVRSDLGGGQSRRQASRD
jgi:hypothetical protein